MDKKNMFDIQYLDNNFEQYYFIPWPDCQYYDELEDDDNVIPVATGSFISKQLIAEHEDNL